MAFMGDAIDFDEEDYFKENLGMNLENGECSTDVLDRKHFSVTDYVVFGIMFVVTISIGLFHGCYKGRKSTASEYLVGNRQMHFFPVAMSLIAGILNAVSVLGNPSEMYNYGSQLYMLCLAFLVSGPLAVSIYVPIYQGLQITSVYEYMNLRFHSSVRTICSLLFLVQGLLHCSLAMFAPALALSQVTNMKLYVVLLITFSICVFFGSIGGVKAIIWSDTLQYTILFISLLVLLIRGTMKAGGIDIVWNDSYDTDRIELFNFDPDPTLRHTFWSVFVGGTVLWTAICAVNQSTIQRFLALPSMRDAKKAIWIATFGKIIIYTMLYYIGMLMYSSYKNCDPLSSKMVKRSDQLLPLYFMEVVGDLPGFPGILVANIFSTSIGTVATIFNGMTAVTVRDVVQGLCKKKLSDLAAGTLSKFICLGYGLISIGFIFLIMNLGGLLQASFSLTGIVGGVGLGVFTLGVFFPWANWKGALGGIIFSNVFLIWISWGYVEAVKQGFQSGNKKPISVSDCHCNATIDIPTGSPEGIFPLYEISYLWYTALGTIVSVIFGMVISALTGFQDPRELDQALISPLAKWFFRKLPINVRDKLKLPSYEIHEKG